ncbi:methylated-DNA--[protein]-cysteine S-methyltransferase [Pradoshia sp. D12]|uniref:methylated-DNA--[protein]-cysteine S-methyltransferase n=1 Tax=Bacillaceae TaxID=186817 RepID=UPI00112A01C4|nr:MULTISPECIES: methylated-DNA--[protein]-cysteine S-methyltransferase [Bacillaceae]QFK70416.1 methylated-DNA--[protein]-cysteine S-methyltransferase [Pradoshia sp. D12]TPF72211.1 methylated-DNA--[protein]-cysteine S-methyltransferase [Bacillus sp. D12]
MGNKYAYYYTTLIGKVGIAEDGIGITDVFLGEKPIEAEEKETQLIKETAKQLEEYFKGEREQFTLKLNPRGTPFQQSVWKELVQIPYGETRSYKQVAERIGNPSASRAVGMANNKNPIFIIVPCHRVIGATGKLVGYGGGLDIKEKLLGLEFERITN